MEFSNVVKQSHEVPPQQGPFLTQQHAARNFSLRVQEFMLGALDTGFPK